MNKQQFIEKSLKELEIFDNDRRVTGTVNELKDFLQSALSECWDMAGEDKDYIVVKDHEIAQDLAKNYKGKDLKGKWIIIAPAGLEMVSMEDLLRLPQIKKYINSLTSKQEDKKG